LKEAKRLGFKSWINSYPKAEVAYHLAEDSEFSTQEKQDYYKAQEVTVKARQEFYDYKDQLKAKREKQLKENEERNERLFQSFLKQGYIDYDSRKNY